MKKRVIILFFVMVFLTVCALTACDHVVLEHTEGLVFTLDEETDTYSVTDYTGTSTKLIIPHIYEGKSVTNININSSTFPNWLNLTSIVIPASVTSIGDDAFKYCCKLVEIYNLSSLNITIGSSDYGYVGCYALDIYTSLDIPSKLSTDENGYIIYTDGEDKKLVGYTGADTELTLPGGITQINKYAFAFNNNITSVTIPASVTSIGEGAFGLCSNLTTVTFEGNSQLASIGDLAFSGCSKLNSITIPASVTSIGESAFGLCSNLTTVTFEENSQLTSIGDLAFCDCSNLTSITIPASVTSIGVGAFDGCSNLTDIYYTGTEEQWDAISKGYDWDYNTGDYTIYYNCCTIHKYEDTYSYNDTYHFYACEYCGKPQENIEHTIVDNACTICDYVVLEHTEGLVFTLDEETDTYSVTNYTGTSTKVIIPYIYKGKLVTSIGSDAFEYCDNLTTITIPASVTSIGEEAFDVCDNLTTVNYLGTLEQWLNISFGGYAANPCYYGAQLYIDSTLLTGELVIPDTITEIKDYAFSGYTSITSVTIPASVTSISWFAFWDCSNLTTVIFEENSQLTSIGGGAFSGCSKLNSITIPASVTSIGDFAFAYCDNLTDIYYTGTEEQWNAISKGNYWNYGTGDYTIHYNYSEE